MALNKLSHCRQGFANNKCGDQTKHLHRQTMHLLRLITAFVIRFAESIISKLATSELSRIAEKKARGYCYVADGTGLNLALSETPKIGFVSSRSK